MLSFCKRLLILSATAIITTLPAANGQAYSATPLAKVTSTPSATMQALADFDFVTEKVSRNYAGWEFKTAGARGDELMSLTRRLRSEVERGGVAALPGAVRAYLAWFDDGHLFTVWNEPEGMSVPWATRPRAVNEVAARRILSTPNRVPNPIEGIWRIDDAYRLAILARDREPNVFDAIVLSTSSKNWQAGEVKAILTARSEGGYDVRYGAGDRTLARFGARLIARGDALKTEGFGNWVRVVDDPADALKLSRRLPDFAFSFERVNADTVRLRIPSFGLEHLETIRDLIKAHRADIAATPNLIIDVRDNVGGGDRAFMPLLDFTYTRPIHRIGVETRATPDNLSQLRSLRDQIRSAAPDVLPLFDAEIARMEKATTPYVPGWPYPLEVIRLDSVMPTPSCVAILIDNAASAAENFILAARQSRKVTLMGQANSAGVLDFGNVTPMPAPSGSFVLHWPMTRSLRLPLDPVDPDGIAPDVLIPQSAEDPVLWASERLQGCNP